MKSNPVYPLATIIFWSLDVSFPAKGSFPRLLGQKEKKEKIEKKINKGHVNSVSEAFNTEPHLCVRSYAMHTFIINCSQDEITAWKYTFQELLFSLTYE